MPKYEYRCLDCKRKFEVFIPFAEYGSKPVLCTFCQSAHVTRRIGRIRVVKSQDSRLESFSDSASLEGMEEDPVALGKMMRRMSGELGESMPPEFDEVVDRLEKGQSPQEIENDLPDFGDEGGGGELDDEF